MTEVLAILVFVLLFAAFPLVVRENKRKGGCGFCAFKKAFGLCDGCPVGDPGADRPGGRGGPEDDS